MSSNIRVNRICAFCGKEFEARKTTTKTCSDSCAKRAYKAQQRMAKIEASDQHTEQIKAKPVEDLRREEYLTVEESARLVRVSRRTLYRLNERGELPFTKLSRRTVIRRSDIDRLFEPPSTTQSEVKIAVPITLSDCYTMKEIMEQYAISEKALYDLVKRNQIPKQYSGRYAYVPKTRIDELLKNTLNKL